MKVRVKKKHEAGAAVAYISRRQALKKLQLSLKDFRRLCILKGIYPHEPAHKKKANKGSTANKVFYYRKDINFLAHEPIINKFREYKVFLRKLNHYKAKNEETKLKKLYENKPEYNLDVVVKERFPTFGSAIRDLDDALSLCFTFSMLPHTRILKEGMIENCKRLTTEFMHYIIEANALKNTFISIKGIYYQAEICGEKVTWIVPHERGLPHVTDVDFTILVTFAEFYIAMLGFVNYKLYQMIGLYYPPQIQTGQLQTEEEMETEDYKERLYSLAKPLVKNKTDSLTEEDPIDIFGDEENALALKIKETKAIKSLFKNCVFFINRECPKEALTFIIRNCGGIVGWQSGPTSIEEGSKAITHQVVDRPMEKFDINRRYVQPQWIFDCLNARRKLPTEKYLPGVKLPPHFSPFTSEKPGDYVPVERLDELRSMGKDVTELENAIPKTEDELPKRKKQPKEDQKQGVHVSLGKMHKKSKEKFHETVEQGNELKLREMMIPKKASPLESVKGGECVEDEEKRARSLWNDEVGGQPRIDQCARCVRGEEIWLSLPARLPNHHVFFAAASGAAMENHVGERTVNVFGKVFPRDAFICRLFYLTFFASFGSLFPLLAVYFKQLGMTAAQTGFLLGSRPLIEFASGPFWGSFASRFRKQKLLLLFSLGSLIVFTLAVGLVQPVTPYCVVYLPEGNRSCRMMLAPAGNVIRGGALGMLKEAVVGGSKRQRRQTQSPIIEKIIDLSSFDSAEDTVAGIAPEYITRERVCNYVEEEYGVLVSPPHSTRVYRQPAVEQGFMLLLILIVLGEFCSSPALALADAATLQAVKEQPQEFGKIRLFASVGWGLAMFVMGIGLDYSDTFRNHPCPAENTTEKNYTLCFVISSIFMLAAMLLATKFKFGDDVAPTTEVAGLVMDTRESEVSHVVAEKARARQLQADSAENSLLTTVKVMASPHLALYLLSVVVMGGGAGLVFSFLFWHLQDLGGSPVLFGILSVTNHASEIVAYFYTFQIINKFGHVKVMYICLGVNVFRFLALSWLDNPWMVLPLQVLQGVCLATVWASASSYISLVAPPHIKSNAQYILQLGYHGLGKGIGSMVGGSVISVIGSRYTFALYGLICFLMCVGSFGLNKLFKYEGIKYGAGNFDEEDVDIMAPQGVPMARDGKLTDAFNTAVVNANYGAISQEDPTQDAYDRYVSSTR
ncbi:unnamed protein product [Caenorhabditis auriculariae]|uniref:Pescadillo homolog n=1 Tax=Caenorhabditis auriculariae TaxID=2777116 RepID=A0A8S1HNH3_9PELO|nr:unnamed protein product [Caenorhabditis auriculariae]